MLGKEIYLSKSDLRILEKLERDNHVEWASIETVVQHTALEHYDLVVPSRSGKYAILTQEGRQVLLQYREEKQNQRSEHAHNWYIAIFSTIGGALLSEPLWAGIRWLISWLSKNL